MEIKTSFQLIKEIIFLQKENKEMWKIFRKMQRELPLKVIKLLFSSKADLFLKAKPGTPAHCYETLKYKFHVRR